MAEGATKPKTSPARPRGAYVSYPEGVDLAGVSLHSGENDAMRTALSQRGQVVYVRFGQTIAEAINGVKPKGS